MKKEILFFCENNTGNNKFLSFANNEIAKANTCKITGGGDELPLPEEDSDFIIIEDLVDL